MVSKKIIVSLAKLANDLDSLKLKKEATALDHVWIRLAYGPQKDYSRFQGLKDSGGESFDFNLDPMGFNQKYDLPHPSDAEDYWIKKLDAPPSGSLEAIDEEIKTMAYEMGGQLGVDDGKIRDAWMRVFDETLSPVGFKPQRLQPNWKEQAKMLMNNYLK